MNNEYKFGDYVEANAITNKYLGFVIDIEPFSKSCLVLCLMDNQSFWFANRNIKLLAAS